MMTEHSKPDQLGKLTDRQVFKTAPWLQRLLAEHRKDKRACPSCGGTLKHDYDALTGKGVYRVHEACNACDLGTTTEYPPEWVARTTARIRRENGTLKHGG
jgi:hypothetical protein